MSFEDVDKLFITHMHSDHLVGIPDVWLTSWIMGRRTRPFQVWGPEGTQAMMSYLEKAFAEDIRLRRDVLERFPDAGISVQAYDITEGVIYEQNGVRITAFLVDHGPIKPSLGFRLDWASSRSVFQAIRSPLKT